MSLRAMFGMSTFASRRQDPRQPSKGRPLPASRLLWSRNSALVVFGLATILVSGVSAAQPKNRKAIVLGFDGVDPSLCEKYMREGHLANLAKLRDKGTFLALATTNPAESPVAWAALTTGSNPGKTNIFDFLESKREKGVPPYPDIALVHPASQHAHENECVRRLMRDRTASAIGSWVELGLRLCVVGLHWYHVLGFPALDLERAILLGNDSVARYLPEEIPVAVNTRQGSPFWSVAAQQGLRATILEAPLAFPPDDVNGVRLLSGLGVPDVANTWGFWSFFTSDPKAKLNTETGGWIYPIRPKNGVATAFVHGPEDIVAKDHAARLVEKIRTAKTRTEQLPLERDLANVLAAWFDPLVNMVTTCDLDEEFKGRTVADLERERQMINRLGSGEAVRAIYFSQMFVPMRLEIDAVAKTLRATVQGRTTNVRLGEWSRDWVTIDYRMSPLLHVKGIAKLYLQRVEPNVEIVMTPIQFHPGDVSPILAISNPHDFARDLCDEIGGPFETLGWSTMTNPAKDDRLDDDGFLKQTWGVFDTVRRLSLAELEKRDWDVFFTMFAVTDRMQHMMFRMIDPKNPRYQPELAKKYGDEILKIYDGMDRFVGVVMDQYVDADTILLVVSDHGFKSFRRGVNLNTWLQNEQYQSGSVDSVGNIDWRRTKAYAIGLGGIYINRKSHEGIGIVDDKDYDALCDEIVTKLRLLKDDDGTPVVKGVYKQRDIYHGNWLARAPDLVVGFNEGYRVSWETTLGSAPQTVIENNDQRWSGDHSSVDPSLVPGVLFSNQKLAAKNATIVDIAPTVCAFLGIAPDGDWDGKALPVRAGR